MEDPRREDVLPVRRLFAGDVEDKDREIGPVLLDQPTVIIIQQEEDRMVLQKAIFPLLVLIQMYLSRRETIMGCANRPNSDPNSLTMG